MSKCAGRRTHRERVCKVLTRWVASCDAERRDNGPLAVALFGSCISLCVSRHKASGIITVVMATRVAPD